MESFGGTLTYSDDVAAIDRPPDSATLPARQTSQVDA